MKNLFLTCLLVCFSLSSSVSADTYVLDESYGNVPVTFVPNVGQFDSTIAVVAEGNDGDVLSSNYGAVFQLEGDDTIRPISPDNTNFNEKLCLQFMNANLNPEVSFEDPVAWKSNYFIGNDPENWHTDVPNYRAARLHDVYPGIDMMFRGNDRDIEYLLVIKPGADGSQILFRDYDGYINGAGGTTLHGQKLWLYLELVNYFRTAISAFQYIDGKETHYPISFTYIHGDIKMDRPGLVYIDYVAFNIGINETGNDIYIKLDMFDSPLVALKHSSGAAEVEIDDEGYAYVAGNVEYNKRRSDSFKSLFAMKLNPDGDGLEYVTYFGADTQIHHIVGIKVDSMHNLYAAGYFNGNFPLTEDSFDRENNNSPECFIINLNQKGNKILHSSYLGGYKYEDMTCLDIDDNNNIYLAGATTSPDFPVTNYSYDNTFTPHIWEGFVTKIDSSLTNIIFSTFLDGAQFKDIKVNLSENIYLTGENTGTIEFPTTNDAYDPDYNGGNDAIIVKLSSDGDSLLYSTYVGGSGKDVGSAIDIDEHGKAVITGNTYSTDFPTKSSILSNINNGLGDAFILKINESGSDIIFSGYLGGSNLDEPSGLGIDNNGNIIISGYTISPEFPTTSDAYLNDIMQGDGFFTTISSDGKNINYSTLLPGTVYNMKIYTKSDAYLGIYGLFPELSGKGVFDSNSVSLVKLKVDETTSVFNESNQPNLFSVYSPYPNPFNPSVTLSYKLFNDSNVTLDIFNIQGQKISTIVNNFQEKGSHRIQWDGSDFPSGVYFYQIRAGNERKIGKIMLLK